MTVTTRSKCRIARRADEQGAGPPMGNQAGIEKLVTGSNKSENYNELKEKDKLLKCKQNLFITTFNARTLSAEANQFEMVSLVEKLGIEVLCVQEHRIYHEDVTIKTHNMGSAWRLMTSSATKAANNTTIGGVGLLIGPKALKSLVNI